jgi:ketosteroid isomerase-like protein
MSDRDAVERLILDAYAARDAGDAERCLQCVGPHASFRLVGGIGELPDRPTAGAQELRDAIEGLIKNFDFVSREILSFVVEGNRAAVHSRVKLRFNPNKREFETDLLDLWHVENGKITSLVEFADTATVGKVIGAPS